MNRRWYRRLICWRRLKQRNGTVLTRLFVRTATIAEVFAWLQTRDELESLPEWTLALPAGVPPLEGGLLPTDESLDELGLLNVFLYLQGERA